MSFEIPKNPENEDLLVTTTAHAESLAERTGFVLELVTSGNANRSVSFYQLLKPIASGANYEGATTDDVEAYIEALQYELTEINESINWKEAITSFPTSTTTVVKIEHSELEK